MRNLNNNRVLSGVQRHRNGNKQNLLTTSLEHDTYKMNAGLLDNSSDKGNAAMNLLNSSRAGHNSRALQSKARASMFASSSNKNQLSETTRP